MELGGKKYSTAILGPFLFTNAWIHILWKCYVKKYT
jgi:hypothetical protein